MPLKQGKSEKAFEHNVKAEMHAGKPQKQALAIAYAVKRKNMASGGQMKVTRKNMAHGGQLHETEMAASKIGHPHSMVAKHAKGGMHCAHGGPAHCAHGCYAEGGLLEHAVGKEADGEHKGATHHETEMEASKMGHPQSKLERHAEGGPVHHVKHACGGHVENEKLHPEHEEEMPSDMRHYIHEMQDGEEDDQSELDKHAHGGMHYAKGSLVHAIMQDRAKKMAFGGPMLEVAIKRGAPKMAGGGHVVEEDADEMPAYGHRMELQRTHFIEDKEHDVDADPSHDDHSLVGEILKDRKKKSYGLR